jgi:hypothetical protein
MLNILYGVPYSSHPEVVKYSKQRGREVLKSMGREKKPVNLHTGHPTGTNY